MVKGSRANWGFAEQFTVKEIFMGQPNRDLLSNSRSKKFSWDSQTAIR